MPDETVESLRAQRDRLVEALTKALPVVLSAWGHCCDYWPSNRATLASTELVIASIRAALASPDLAPPVAAQRARERVVAAAETFAEHLIPTLPSTWEKRGLLNDLLEAVAALRAARKEAP